MRSQRLILLALGLWAMATLAFASVASADGRLKSANRTDGAASQTIVHVQSGRCLDGSISQGVRLNTCNGGLYQQWDLIGWEIRHVQSGRCLDGSISQGVRLNTCNGGLYQQWGTWTGYELVHMQSGRCLDGSISQGVRLNTCNGGAYQEWIF